jgi:hypothetical protein
LGLANQVIDLKVASLLTRSPLSQGLHRGGSDEDTGPTLTLVLPVGSTSDKADSWLRFIPLDICKAPDELSNQSINKNPQNIKKKKREIKHS